VGDIAWVSCFVALYNRGCLLLPDDEKLCETQAIVRPTVEYVSSARDPYQENHIKKIETVQRRSARFIKHQTKGQTRIYKTLHRK
jgi:hypothetical protein